MPISRHGFQGFPQIPKFMREHTPSLRPKRCTATRYQSQPRWLGCLHAGGVLIYMDASKTYGLVASATEIRSSIAWSPGTLYTTTTGATSIDQRFGEHDRNHQRLRNGNLSRQAVQGLSRWRVFGLVPAVTG